VHHNFFDTLLNGPSRYTQEHHFEPWLTLVFVISILFAEIVGVYVLVRLLVVFVRDIPALFGFVLRKCGIGEKDAPQTFLELTFPADTTKSAFATEQLHILLRTLVKYYGFWDRAAARKKPYSLELVGTKDDGIRYILMIPTRSVDIVSRNLLSFLPGLKIKQIDDYLMALKEGSRAGVFELKLSCDFVLPLQDHKALAEHDPIAYLTGHMTKLAPHEMVAFQIVTTPVYPTTHRRVTRRVTKMQHTIALNREISTQLVRQRTPLGFMVWLLWYPPLWFLAAMGKLLGAVGDIFFTVFSRDHELPAFMKGDAKKRPTSNPYEQELGGIIKTKLDQQLFEVTMRLMVAASDQEAMDNKLNALLATLEPFATPYQSIAFRKPVPILLPGKQHVAKFTARTLSPHHVSQQTILSSSELSDLYHFPNTDMVKTEGFVKSRSRELPAPLSIKHSNAELDVIVGVNKHGGDFQEIGMTLAQRQKHTYVIGKTGTGKTTLLTSAIYQDMVNGKGLAVLDPHGDMFQELLSIVPKRRQKDVIVFDPSDREYPLGLNLLDPGIPFDNDDDKHEWITSAVLSVFTKLADERQWGPRMEHILRNATMTALQTPNPSLYTIQRLLTDKQYQKDVAATLKDPVLKQFWDKEFKLLGKMQLSSVTAPLTHRLGHFITTKMSRHILLQEKSTLSIADIMNEGKILLVNLSKGDIGEDQSFFFGTILTSFIWMAAYQRTKIPEKQRRDFFIYVDEFQNFATPQFADITSEGRKFHVSLIVSHQNIAQIEDQSILKVMAGNATTMICLKASPEDEEFILPYMEPEVEAGDIVNLAPYHFYMKTTGDVSEDAFSGETVPVEAQESSKTKDDVVSQSRRQYGVPKAEVEEYLEGLFTEESTSSTSPKVAKIIKKGPKKRLHGA
jgi:hypothetical protein